MLIRHIGIPISFIIIALTSSCANITPTNEPLTDFKSHQPQKGVGLRVSSLNSCQENDSQGGIANCENKNKRVLIGVAISGGGSRAANFSASVLKSLNELGILRHINTISSVSGGSLTAAYVATHFPELTLNSMTNEPWDRVKQDLSRDIRSAWIEKTLRPDNFLKTTLGDTGRTRFLADVLDDFYFHDARFSSLESSEAPSLIINATAINQLHGIPLTGCINGGDLSIRAKFGSFSFTEEIFSNCLKSDISKYKISMAVASSAAFPGVFSSVPLARFEKLISPKSEIVTGEYLHLMDGGPSDNLAIEGITADAVAEYKNWERSKFDDCLLIVIDSYVQGAPDRRNSQVDPRGFLGRVVDLDFFDAIDAMLAHRRFETLRRLGIDTAAQSDLKTGTLISGLRFPDDLLLIPKVKTTSSNTPLVREDEIIRKVPPPTCTIWHLAMDNLLGHINPRTLDAKGIHQNTPPDYTDGTKNGDQLYNRTLHILDIWETVRRIDTDFNISGPKRCSKNSLRDALWEAGKLIVSEDTEGRKTVCDWFLRNGIPTSNSCSRDIHPAINRPNKIIYRESGRSPDTPFIAYPEIECM